LIASLDCCMRATRPLHLRESSQRIEQFGKLCDVTGGECLSVATVNVTGKADRLFRMLHLVFALFCFVRYLLLKERHHIDPTKRHFELNFNSLLAYFVLQV